MKGLLPPFGHGPLTNEFSFQIEDLNATVAQIGDIDRLAPNRHTRRIVKFTDASSLLTPLSDRVTVAIQHHDACATLIHHVQIPLWSNRDVTRPVEPWRRSTPLRHHTSVSVELDKLLIN
jgi:hypothetical protein